MKSFFPIIANYLFLVKINGSIQSLVINFEDIFLTKVGQNWIIKGDHFSIVKSNPIQPVELMCGIVQMPPTFFKHSDSTNKSSIY